MIKKKNTNKESTRYYSDQHEKSVCYALGARQQSNSGASKFQKGDVVTHNMLIECKTTMTDKESVSIKKEWVEKNKEEAFQVRRSYSAICINFGPEQENFYLINEKLMKFLVQALETD